MSAEFSNQLASMFDDIAASIQPRADFDAARAGAATLPLAPAVTAPGGGRPGRHIVAAAAAAALLFAGGVAAYELAGDDADSVSTATDDATDIVDTVDTVDDLDRADDRVDAPAAGDDATRAETGRSATVAVGDAVERSAVVAAIDWERTPPVVVLEGTAPDGEPIEVFSIAGAADTVARGGSWRLELALDRLDDGVERLVVIVEFGDGDSVHLVVERPVERSDDTEPTADEPKVDEPKQDEPKQEEPKRDEPTDVAFAAVLGEFVPTHEPPKVLLHGTAPAGTKVVASSPYGEQHVVAGEGGGWELWLLLWDMPGGATAPIRVAHPASGGVAEFSVSTPSKPAPPKSYAFEAALVEGGTAEGRLWRRFGGTATPGSIVHASSGYGTATATVGEHGEWTLKLWLDGTPPASNIAVEIANSVDPKVHTFTIETPPAPSYDFTAQLVEGGTIEGRPWRRFGGTATPGSTVSASSDYGSATTAVAEHGEWTLKLVLEGAPPGSKIAVQVTNTATMAVHQFTIETPAAPPTVEFTANAAFVECDSTPPFNEYWGTAQPGSVVVISSPYGGAERTAGEQGGWDARIEFPDAPVGEVFTVKVKSIATGQVKEFPMQRIEPAG